ncbi:uncharacterized protein EDB91DRAFT_49478 [Suillus paluster]|uniref:uncharacterized protein n=1 Tax=Suillus paluster TaxID=48578 RepID=UPI001B863810|nr:uncharacterized protein EDB91DRAFT_49478 [Suillus paluster]KAG1747903.1 hypothetical protein EDB91DRAFT_49478 [Suillus paluster]
MARMYGGPDTQVGTVHVKHIQLNSNYHWNVETGSTLHRGFMPVIIRICCQLGPTFTGNLVKACRPQPASQPCQTPFRGPVDLLRRPLIITTSKSRIPRPPGLPFLRANILWTSEEIVVRREQTCTELVRRSVPYFRTLGPLITSTIAFLLPDGPPPANQGLIKGPQFVHEDLLHTSTIDNKQGKGTGVRTDPRTRTRNIITWRL